MKNRRIQNPPRHENVTPAMAKAAVLSVKYDNVNFPRHYNSAESRCTCGRQIQCIDIVRNLNFNIGNTIKYLWRYEHKNGIEDLKKAIDYTEKAVVKNKKLNKFMAKPNAYLIKTLENRWWEGKCAG